MSPQEKKQRTNSQKGTVHIEKLSQTSNVLPTENAHWCLRKAKHFCGCKTVEKTCHASATQEELIEKAQEVDQVVAFIQKETLHLEKVKKHLIDKANTKS